MSDPYIGGGDAFVSGVLTLSEDGSGELSPLGPVTVHAARGTVTGGTGPFPFLNAVSAAARGSAMTALTTL
jgi:hypothetical protein